MGDTYDTTVCFGRRRPGLQNGRKTLEIPINKPPYSSKNRSIIPKNDVKNTKLGNFLQSPGRNLDSQRNFKIRGKSQKPSCTTDTMQENTVGA